MLKRFSKTERIALIVVGAILVITGICLVILLLNQTSLPAIPQATPTLRPSPTPEYLLELLAMNDIKTSDKYFQVHGQVKNVSQQRLSNVEAVINLYDSNGNFIMSDSALIEFDPILPGQLSPFRITILNDPKVTRYNVIFKHYRGSVISTKDSR